jgi:MATE family multidrug resistance protein
MIYAGLGYWGVGMPMSLLFGFGMGLEGLGIWIGLAAGLAVVAVIMMARWIRRDRLGLVPARS